MGASATVLYEFTGTEKGESLGSFISPSPVDLNDDGYHDILITSPEIGHGGVVDAYSGRTGRLLYQFRAEVLGEYLGTSVSGIGDINGDGIDDVVIGAPANVTNFTGGHAYAFAGNDVFLQASPLKYKAGDTVRLDMRGDEPKSLAMIALVDVNGSPLFVPIVVAPLNAFGNLRFTDAMPSGLSGTNLSFMGYAVKAGGKGVSDSIVETIEVK